MPADNPPGVSWGSQAGNAASGSGRALATNPGSNGAGVIQLAVTNGIGVPALSVQLAYDLRMLWGSPGDDGSQLPGYSVFWSTTGGATAGDWTKPGDDSVAGSKAWKINLPVALNPGVDFYAGDRLLAAITNATDETLARNFQHGLFDPAGIDDLYDYNRDGLVDGTDQILARNNQTNPLNMLRLISPPARSDALGASKSAAGPGTFLPGPAIGRHRDSHRDSLGLVFYPADDKLTRIAMSLRPAACFMPRQGG